MTATSRRDFLLNSAMALGAGMLPSAANAGLAGFGAPKMNLILYFTDEMRADALSCYGNPVTKTPNFDLLARQGTQFRNCHVQNPVCAQSRCSMLTGWPTSVRGHRSLYYLLRPDEPNMFRYLKQAGYDVFWFGKNDAMTPESFHDSVTAWKDIMPRSGYGRLPAGPQPDAPTTMLFPGGGDRRQTLDYPMVQEAIMVLEQRERDRPFCIFLPLLQPHPPYRAPEGFDTLYKPESLPPLAPPGLPGKPQFHAAIRQRFGLDKIDDLTLRKVRAAYYGQVSYSDWLLGELMEAIERTGHAHDTALIASSDHGDYAGDYGLVEKWPSGLESNLTHVPLIARVPGGKAGVVAPDMVELFDIMPTFLALAGTQARHTHFARSLLPQIHGGAGDPDRAAFSEGGYNVYEPQAFEPREQGLYGPKTNLQNDRPETIQRAASVKTQQYTYISRPGGQSEFYDRARDPLETRNLIDSHTHAHVREALQTRLLNWYVDTSGVPAQSRDARDMPAYIPDEPFADKEVQTVRLLDR